MSQDVEICLPTDKINSLLYQIRSASVVDASIAIGHTDPYIFALVSSLPLSTALIKAVVDNFYRRYQ